MTQTQLILVSVALSFLMTLATLYAIRSIKAYGNHEYIRGQREVVEYIQSQMQPQRRESY